MSSPSYGSTDNEVAREAEQLLRAHGGDQPLLLPNVWDTASARAVASGGVPIVAASSRAIAQVLGEADDDSSDPDIVFSFVARIARAVLVTADLEAGLRFSPSELVDRVDIVANARTDTINRHLGDRADHAPRVDPTSSMAPCGSGANGDAPGPTSRQGREHPMS